jgi:hypothetical protein
MAIATKMVGDEEENTTSSYMTALSANGGDDNDATAASGNPRMRLWDLTIATTTTADGGGGEEEEGEGDDDYKYEGSRWQPDKTRLPQAKPTLLSQQQAAKQRTLMSGQVLLGGAFKDELRAANAEIFR